MHLLNFVILMKVLQSKFGSGGLVIIRNCCFSLPGVEKFLKLFNLLWNYGIISIITVAIARTSVRMFFHQNSDFDRICFFQFIRQILYKIEVERAFIQNNKKKCFARKSNEYYVYFSGHTF